MKLIKSIYIENDNVLSKIHELYIKEEDAFGKKKFSIEIHCSNPNSAEELAGKLVGGRRLAGMAAELANYQQYIVQLTDQVVTVNNDIDAALIVMTNYCYIDDELIKKIEEDSEIKELRSKVSQWSKKEFGPKQGEFLELRNGSAEKRKEIPGSQITEFGDNAGQNSSEKKQRIEEASDTTDKQRMSGPA